MYSSGRRSRWVERLACSFSPGSPQQASGVGVGVWVGVCVGVGGRGEGEGSGEGVAVGVELGVGRREGSVVDEGKGVASGVRSEAHPANAGLRRISRVKTQALIQWFKR